MVFFLVTTALSVVPCASFRSRLLRCHFVFVFGWPNDENFQRRASNYCMQKNKLVLFEVCNLCIDDISFPGRFLYFACWLFTFFWIISCELHWSYLKYIAWLIPLAAMQIGINTCRLSVSSIFTQVLLRSFF